jgi:hypothetical protein
MDDFRKRLQRNLRLTRELRQIQNPRFLAVMRFNKRICDERGIPHDFDAVLELLRRL